MTTLHAEKQIHEAEPLPGDILVFLSGQEDIEALAQLLEEEQDDGVANGAATGGYIGDWRCMRPAPLSCPPTSPLCFRHHH